MVRGAACAQTGAYISDDKSLFMVVGPGKRDMLILEDCSDGVWSEMPTWRVKTDPWFLVRAAPVEDWEVQVAG